MSAEQPARAWPEAERAWSSALGAREGASALGERAGHRSSPACSEASWLAAGQAPWTEGSQAGGGLCWRPPRAPGRAPVSAGPAAGPRGLSCAADPEPSCAPLPAQAAGCAGPGAAGAARGVPGASASVRKANLGLSTALSSAKASRSRLPPPSAWSSAWSSASCAAWRAGECLSQQVTCAEERRGLTACKALGQKHLVEAAVATSTEPLVTHWSSGQAVQSVRKARTALAAQPRLEQGYSALQLGVDRAVPFAGLELCCICRHRRGTRAPLAFAAGCSLPSACRPRCAVLGGCGITQVLCLVGLVRMF